LQKNWKEKSLMRGNLLRLSLTLTILIAISFGCSFDKDNPYTSVVTDTSAPNTPQPADKSVNQLLVVTLKWECNEAVSYNIYFDTQSSPAKLIALNNTQKYQVVSNLEYGKTYYWKIVANFLDGSNKTGPVWSFTTGTNANPSGSGYVMYMHSISTTLPSNVNAMYQVVDMSNHGVTNLNSSDFEVYEDGAALSSESQVSIKKHDQLPFKIRTVLMLDNSTSLTNNIDQIRNAAETFIGNILPSQEVAIYQFSDSPILIRDFTNNKDTLIASLKKYQLGYSTTDLYGSVVKGASLWFDNFSPDSVLQGSMIIFTDGNDTQGSSTLSAAINAVSYKKVYTIGLGSEIQPEVLQAIGTAGYYQLSGVTQLPAQFQAIQTSILEYVNSFYMLSYKSPKRGSEDHQVIIRIKNNPYTGSGSFISGYYNSAGFYSAKINVKK
jgi:hypothetical protein